MLDFLIENNVPLRRRLPATVEQIGASKDCIITFDVGPTYRGLMIELLISATPPTRAQIETMLTNWWLTMSGDDLFNISGLLLVAIQEFYLTGVIGDTGYVYIPFDRNFYKDLEAVRGPGLGTMGETSLVLRITQDATNTIDGIKAYGVIHPKPAVPGKHVRIRRLTPPLPGAGNMVEWSPSPLDPTDNLLAMHFQVSTAADLTYVSYVADTMRLLDQTTQAQLAAYYRQQSPTRTLQTAKKVISFDFTMDGWGLGVPQNMVKQNLEYLFANAPTTLIIAQEYGTEKLTAAGRKFLEVQAAAAK